jgi:hypothetical protein
MLFTNGLYQIQMIRLLKMEKKTLAFLCFLLLLGIESFAQETEQKFQEFKIGAEIRPRLEYYHGYKQLAAPNQKHGLSVSQRTRLNLDFRNPNFKVKISLQDVRIWGNQDQGVANEDFATSVHEAWGEAILSPIFSIKIGRQEIGYDDQRIFGLVDWGQQGRSHDAAIFKLTTANLKAEFALAYNQDGLNLTGTDNVARASNYKAFQNLWLNYKFSDQINTSILFLNNGMQKPTGGDAYSQTFGGRFTYKEQGLTAHLAFYNQGGEMANSTKIRATYVWADLGYKFSDMFNTTLGFEKLSGNDQLENSNQNNAFAPLFATAHKFNGHMDYFYSGNHAGSVGLNNLFLQLGIVFPKIQFGLHTHYFASDGRIARPGQPGQAMDKYLGLEFDLFCDFKLSKEVAVKAGYSQMFASEAMEVLKGGSKDETNNWAFLMVTFKPTLFESKKEME